jgi:hypothetical protein
MLPVWATPATRPLWACAKTVQAKKLASAIAVTILTDLIFSPLNIWFLR